MHNRVAPHWFLKTYKMFQSHCHPNRLLEMFQTARGSPLSVAGLSRIPGTALYRHSSSTSEVLFRGVKVPAACYNF